MPANFTEEQRQSIRENLFTIGKELIREIGLKKMKVSLIAERAQIATGTFYHFFESKEAYVRALIDEQDRKLLGQLQIAAGESGVLTIERVMPYLRDAFRLSNNFLMELSLEDWVWLKAHGTKLGLFQEEQNEQNVQFFLTKIEGVRSDLDPRIIINFFKTIYSMAQNRDTFIAEVFETNISIMFDGLYRYAAIQK